MRWQELCVKACGRQPIQRLADERMTLAAVGWRVEGEDDTTAGFKQSLEHCGPAGAEAQVEIDIDSEDGVEGFAGPVDVFEGLGAGAELFGGDAGVDGVDHLLRAIEGGDGARGQAVEDQADGDAVAAADFEQGLGAVKGKGRDGGGVAGRDRHEATFSHQPLI